MIDGQSAATAAAAPRCGMNDATFASRDNTLQPRGTAVNDVMSTRDVTMTDDSAVTAPLPPASRVSDDDVTQVDFLRRYASSTKLAELERNVDSRLEMAAIALCPRFEPADLIRSNSDKANYDQAFTDAARMRQVLDPTCFWYDEDSTLVWAFVGNKWIAENDQGLVVMLDPPPAGSDLTENGFFCTDPATWPDKDVPVTAPHQGDPAESVGKTILPPQVKP